ncbi:MAG: GxxExxY protein [Planctomycetales bacterium]|nr:GxxExxY protein [Planctomycetales bacterium]
MYEPISDATEAIARRFFDTAFEVHRQLGPGLLESVYETCLCYEMDRIGLPYQRQLVVPIRYRELIIDDGLRLDLLIAEEVVIELKAIEALLPIHEAQLLTYLRLTNKRLGFLVNFNVPLLKQGIKRIVL